MKILVVDDEEIVCVPICDELAQAGYDVSCEDNATAALEQMQKRAFDVLLTDLKMPGMDGLELLKRVRQDYPGTSVMMITAYATVDSAVEAMKLGAYDYVTKPFRTAELLVILQRLKEHRRLQKDNARLRSELVERHGFHRIVGKSPAMQKVYANLEIVCQCDCTVLITGNTGTGKELVADAIHYNGTRKNGPLVKVSCAALPREVLESELFGHVAGAYTGAVRDRKGRFEEADGGTIFLDEVDDIPLESQVKLLRILENRELQRVGEGRNRRVDVRILAASKHNLRDIVSKGRFRDDLFYRLNVVPIELPPLACRAEDIPLLVSEFLGGRTREAPRIDEDAIAALTAYPWPGNVRELRNALERAQLTCRDGTIRPGDLPPEIVEASRPPGGRAQTFDEVVGSLERRLLTEALQRTNGNKTQAAELLGISPSKLRYKLSRLDIEAQS